MKKLLAVLFVMVMTLSLVACGSKKGGDNDNDKDRVTSEPTTEATPEATKEATKEVTAEPTKEATPEPTPEEKAPYYEEKGLTLSKELSYDAPYRIVFSDMDGTKELDYPAYSFAELPPCNVHIDEADIVPSDEEGYVDVTVKVVGNALAVVKYDPMYEDDGGDFFLSYDLPGLALADCYTGRVFPSRRTYNDEVVDVSGTVDWEGESYTVSYEKEIVWNNSWSEWEYNSSDSCQYTNYYITNNVTFKIHMPMAYDGLMFFSNVTNKNANDIFERQTEVDYDEHYMFDIKEGEEPYTADDFYTITLNTVLESIPAADDDNSVG